MRGFLIILAVLITGCNGNSNMLVDERDGQKYRIVRIGNQYWMAENLRFVADSSWCYQDDPADCKMNGRLYHWNSAINACPEGWKLPSDSDWIQLEKYIGIPEEDLLKEKFRGTRQGNRLRSDGDLGFDALISGYRRPNGYYARRGQRSAFWLSTPTSTRSAWHRDIRADTGAIYRSGVPKQYALSVRCIKK